MHIKNTQSSILLPSNSQWSKWTGSPASFNCLIIPLKRSHARHFTTDCVQCSRSTDFIVPLDISIRSMLPSLNRRRRRKAYWMFRSLSLKAHAPDEHSERRFRSERVASLEEIPRLMSDVYSFSRQTDFLCVYNLSIYRQLVPQHWKLFFVCSHGFCHFTSPANIRTRSVFRPGSLRRQTFNSKSRSRS